MQNQTSPLILTFGVADPVGAFGVQADLACFSALGCHGLSAITALLISDTARVEDLQETDPDWVSDQARAVLEDMPVAAFKVGAIANIEQISAIAEIVSDYPELPLILDPFCSSLPDLGLDNEEFLTALRQLLIPQATLLLLSAPELDRLAETWRDSNNDDTLAADVAELFELGCRFVLVTGTPAAGDEHGIGELSNTLYDASGIVRCDPWRHLPGPFIGAGGTLSGALTALMAHGQDAPDALQAAQQFTAGALAHAQRFGMGKLVPNRFFQAQAERAPTTSPSISRENIMTTASNNDTLFARAQKTTPGGVNSPVRAFRSVGGTPRFITRAEGPYIYDADGKRYIDYIGSWGPAIVGHAHPVVVKAVQEAAARGLSFGAPTEGEILMAEEIVRLVPSIEQVRLVSSGTEATMSALRLARGATGRDKIVKFEGCYHGHADSLLVKAGSGLLTFGNPTSAGVPEDFIKHTLVLDYNDVAQLEDAFASMGDTIACVIVEPVAGNMNLIKATPAFLQALRKLCTKHGAILIFDEVMCGFRVALGGAQALYGIRPDLTALGKVIGGGLPVAAFGGRADLMQKLAPLGAVYQAGTLSGNPVAVAAGMSTLKLIQAPGFYESLGAQTAKLAQGLSDAAKQAGVTFCADSIGGMFGIYFSAKVPTSYAEMMAGDKTKFNAFFHAMLDQGVYLAPAAFEAGFVSAAHDDAVIEATVTAARAAFKTLA